MGLKVVMLGHGAVGKALWPCLRQHFGLSMSDGVSIDCCAEALDHARSMGLSTVMARIDRDNYVEALSPWLSQGAVLVNLAVDVSTADLARLTASRDCGYVDAGIEGWPEDWVASANGWMPSIANEREALSKKLSKGQGERTAVVGHGANPGLASSWAKAGIDHLESLMGGGVSTKPWGARAKDLGLRVIQIAEMDHGRASWRDDCFCNTWSVSGLAREALQQGEMGWGSHESDMPKGALLESGSFGASLLLPTIGALSWVKSWTPLGGVGMARVVTHLESVGLSTLLTDKASGYRPTCYYAYRPCEGAVEGLARMVDGRWSVGGPEWVAGGDQLEGMDELGALLMGEGFGSLWIGSRLTSAQSRALAPGVSATTMQVAAGLCAAISWALEYPNMGWVEPEDLPHEYILSVASRWLGQPVVVSSPVVEPLGIKAKGPDDLSWRHFQG